MSKREQSDATGYVYVSPMKKCKDGKSDQFDVVLQDGPSTSKKIKGFKREAHKQLLTFSASKSPVKVSLFKSPSYSLPVVNERSRINPATYQDIPYEYSSSLCKAKTENLDSVDVNISSLEKAPVDDTYYTIKGKLIYGQDPPTFFNGKYVKGTWQYTTKQEVLPFQFGET